MDHRSVADTNIEMASSSHVSRQGVADVTVNSVVTVDLARAPWRSCRAQARERGAEVTTTLDASPLTAADRCDRCGAQAYVRTTMMSGSALHFCAHHWHENETRLREIAVTIHDESERLAEVPASATPDER
jgi:hypothetical protein